MVTTKPMFTPFKKDIERAKTAYQRGAGLVGTLFNFFCGRCTFFAILFTTVGIIQELRGKLDMNFVAFVGAIQALLLAHSAKQDWNQQAQSQAQATTVVNNVTVDTPSATPNGIS